MTHRETVIYFRLWNHEDINIPGNLLNQTIKFISQGIYVLLPYDQLIYIPLRIALGCFRLFVYP